jgi:carbonic anhydrase
MSSIWEDAPQWPQKYTNCGAPNQSPIDLVSGSTEACKELCDLQMDGNTPGMITVQNNGLAVLTMPPKSNQQAIYNGDTYTLDSAILYHPSQHTIEGMRYDGEFVMMFSAGSNKTLCVSVLLESSGRMSSSSQFFKAFVPKIPAGEGSVQVNVGDSWSVLDVLPAEPSYFAYTGSNLIPDCMTPVNWVVFKFTVNIDPDDYAVLTTGTSPGYRPIQNLGKRTVYFNKTPGGLMKSLDDGTGPSDDRIYVKCRRLDENVNIVEGLTMRKTKFKKPVQTNNLIESAGKSVRRQVDGILSIRDWKPVLAVVIRLAVAYVGYYIAYYMTVSGSSFLTNRWFVSKFGGGMSMDIPQMS